MMKWPPPMRPDEGTGASKGRLERRYRTPPPSIGAQSDGTNPKLVTKAPADSRSGEFGTPSILSEGFTWEIPEKTPREL
jgi:hypothetical protein